MGYKDEVKNAKAKMKKMTSPALEKAIKNRYGTDGKRWAREELRKRGVYAHKKVSVSSDEDGIFSSGGMMGGSGFEQPRKQKDRPRSLFDGL